MKLKPQIRTRFDRWEILDELIGYQFGNEFFDSLYEVIRVSSFCWDWNLVNIRIIFRNTVEDTWREK